MDAQVNRAKLLWNNWEEKASKIQELTGTTEDKQTLKYKYKFLSQGLHRLSVNPSAHEKLYMHAIKVVAAKLRKQCYPNPIIRLLHRMQHALVEKPAYLFLWKERKMQSVNELQTQLNSVGLQHFAGKLEKELDFERERIDLKSLSKVDGSDNLEVSVHLERMGENVYHYNGYTATLIPENGVTKSATFSSENNIRINEAINLLQGRPIYKSLQNAANSMTKNWIQLEQVTQKEQGNLELISFSPNYEYDLKKIVLDHSIQLEVYGIANNAVQKGIEAGNLVAFEVQRKGKFYLAANPSEKSVNFYDAGKKPISLAALRKIIKPISQAPNKDLKLIKQKDIEPENRLQVSR